MSAVVAESDEVVEVVAVEVVFAVFPVVYVECQLVLPH